MLIEVNDKFKYACAWMTNEEKDDQELRESLKPMMAEYKKKRYKFVIMESGNGDLLENTKILLDHNKNLAVKEGEFC